MELNRRSYRAEILASWKIRRALRRDKSKRRELRRRDNLIRRAA